MPTPMYRLRLDFSSLVMRPPFIRSRLTQLNQKPVTFVTYFFHRGRTDLRSSLNSSRWRLEVNSKLRTPRVFARRGGQALTRTGRLSRHLTFRVWNRFEAKISAFTPLRTPMPNSTGLTSRVGSHITLQAVFRLEAATAFLG